MKSTQQMFNPDEDDYSTLKEVVVEREDDMHSILGRLESSSVTGTSRSFVVLGPRGAGKTHFLLLLYYEIKHRDNLKNKYISLKFSEEEYSIDSLAFFFIRILEELKTECRSRKEQKRIAKFSEKISNLRNKDLVNEVDSFLNELFQEKKIKIVLFADNLNDILKNISTDNTGLKHLRSILQSKDYLLIIGSAPTFFRQIKDHNEPFYNFFEIIRLSPLTADGIENLFKKLATMEKNQNIIDDMESLKPRIKTIVHFSGGMPRLVRMLYYVIANSEITDVGDSLRKLLDELTPYYQARMKNLSPQQQKIIDTMASLEGPSTPTEIARAGRMERPTVNAQIKKLVEGGFIHLIQQKKRKWRRYDITERMFRIWREMRRSKNRNRIKYLADFLKAYYTPDEFKSHLERIDEKLSLSFQGDVNSEAKKYVKEYEFLKEILPKKMLPDFEIKLIESYIQIEELKKAEDELNYIKDFKEEIKIPKEFDEKLFKLEMTTIEKVLEKNPEDIFNHLKKGALLFNKSRYEDSIKEFNKVLKLNPKNEDALIMRGRAFGILGKPGEALKEFSKFWDDLLLFTIHQILLFSTEDFKKKNYGKSKEKLALLFSNKDLLAREDGNPIILHFLIDIFIIDLNHGIEIFNIFKHELGNDFRGAFSTLDKTIEFLTTNNEELLERLFPEEREVVEELVNRIKREQSSINPDELESLN